MVTAFVTPLMATSAGVWILWRATMRRWPTKTTVLVTSAAVLDSPPTCLVMAWRSRSMPPTRLRATSPTASTSRLRTQRTRSVLLPARLQTPCMWRPLVISISTPMAECSPTESTPFSTASFPRSSLTAGSRLALMQPQYPPMARATSKACQNPKHGAPSSREDQASKSMTSLDLDGSSTQM